MALEHLAVLPIERSSAEHQEWIVESFWIETNLETQSHYCKVQVCTNCCVFAKKRKQELIQKDKGVLVVAAWRPKAEEVEPCRTCGMLKLELNVPLVKISPATPKQ
jgi:hypothetical protein